MELVSSVFASLWVEVAHIDATTRSVPVQTILDEHAVSCVRATKGGMSLIASSGNGQSWTMVANAGDLTPVAYAEMVSTVRKYFRNVRAKFVSEGNPTPSDADLVSGVLEILANPVREYSHDFSRLNV